MIMMMGVRGEMKWKIEMNMTKLHQYFLKQSYFRKGVKKSNRYNIYVKNIYKK